MTDTDAYPALRRWPDALIDEFVENANARRDHAQAAVDREKIWLDDLAREQQRRAIAKVYPEDARADDQPIGQPNI